MLQRRDKVVVVLLASALLGVLLLFSVLGWYLWRESVVAEEARLGDLAQRLGLQAESAIIDARDLLQALNESPFPRCSPEHVSLMQAETFARPHIRAIGFWRAAERLCGTGFAEGAALRPPQASRIYDDGMIAWWPGPDTTVGGIPLFLMRFGNHDMAIDPRQLLSTGPLSNQQVGLWVEGLPMTRIPTDAAVPAPDSLRPGLTVDRAGQQVSARFSLGTIFRIDIVAMQPLSEFWDRYLPTLVLAGLLGLLLAGLWVYVVLSFSRRHLSLTAELRNAIERREILVYYQPIVDLATGRCTGAEALARWSRANGDMVSPDVFVPMAEEAGMITELTLAVLELVLRDIGSLLRAHPAIAININLSPQDLESKRLLRALVSGLREAGLPASAIKLELTERALLDSDLPRRRINELRQLGHAVAIDDFGTGYSSLSYLESFELDILKIDKAFVDTIESHAVSSSVIGHVIEMAKSLQLDIVAEGIESQHQAAWLAAQGVRFGQGYHFSRPLAAEDFSRWLQSQA
ncbi:MAG: EAL domain-containing protein [Haliea sp.]